MSKAVLGFSVAGGGRAGMIHTRNYFTRVPGARLVSVVEPSAEQRRSVAEALPGVELLDSYAPVLDDPRVQAVVIATPTALHRDIAIACAQAGKHIFLEKPMAMDVAECRAINDAVEKAGVVLQLGFMRRFDAGFVDAHERLVAGEIGNAVAVKSLTHGPSTPRPWMYDLTKSNGPLAEVNSHDIDTLRWFTGSEFSEVYAIGGNYRCPDAQQDWPDFYDSVTLIARFANGMQGTISGAQGVRYGYDSRCEVLGEKGLITVGGLDANATRSYHDGQYAGGVVKSWTDLYEQAYLAEDRDFVACINEGRPPRANGRDGLEAVRVVLAGNQSIREQRPIPLEAGAS